MTGSEVPEKNNAIVAEGLLSARTILLERREKREDSGEAGSSPKLGNWRPAGATCMVH